MTFLNPAVLFGLFASLIPVLLHFLNLRKLTKIEFSTLKFLKELQKTKIRRIKFKQWLLLIIRVLIIICLVLAFARPTIKSVTFGNSAAKTSAVIIIDNTFSMSVINEKGSYLNKAKQVAKSLLINFQQGDEVTIITTSDSDLNSISTTTNFSEAKKKIDDIEITNISSTINQNLIKAARVLYQSKNYNKEVYILSDFQYGRIVGSSKEISTFGKTFSPDTRLYFFDLNDKDAVNLGFENIKTANQIFEPGKTIGFSVIVKNYSQVPVNNSVVSLFMNGKRSAQQNLSLNSREMKEILFETTLQDTGLVQVSAELEDDDILQDNKIFTAIYIPSKISLLIASDTNSDSKLIKLALGIPNDKIILQETSNSQLSSFNLKKYNTVFIIGTENITNSEPVTNFINSGGNVILFPGSQNTSSGFQKFLGSFGLNQPILFMGKTNGTNSVSELKQPDFNHPLIADIFEKRLGLKLDSPEIFAYLKIKPDPNIKTVIPMLDNSPFLGEIKPGNGKLILFNSAPTLSWNTFPVKAFFAPLINNCMLYSSAKFKNDSTFHCGDQIIADISNAIDSQIRIKKPDGSIEYINTDSLGNKNYLFYNKTDRPGTYQFYSGSRRIDYISVNNDPNESVTQKHSESDFKDYLTNIGFEGKMIPVSYKDDYTKQIYQSRFGTELWKYFLVIVLFLAVAESLIARSSKKDLIQ